MADLHLLRRLQEQVRWQDRKIVELIKERDQWKEKCEELCHIATYAAEQGNRKGLICLKT